MAQYLRSWNKAGIYQPHLPLGLLEGEDWKTTSTAGKQNQGRWRWLKQAMIDMVDNQLDLDGRWILIWFVVCRSISIDWKLQLITLCEPPLIQVYPVGKSMHNKDNRRRFRWPTLPKVIPILLAIDGKVYENCSGYRQAALSHALNVLVFSFKAYPSWPCASLNQGESILLGSKRPSYEPTC